MTTYQLISQAFELLDVFYYANVGAVQFSKRGEFLAVGKGDGLVQVTFWLHLKLDVTFWKYDQVSTVKRMIYRFGTCKLVS